MVRITSDGDIVNDDDAASNATVQRRRPTDQGPSPNSIARQRDNLDVADVHRGPQLNAWTVANARLREYGIPTYSLYGYKFEPIHFIFTIAAVMLFGVQSLLLIPILLIVTNLSASSGRTSASAHPVRPAGYSQGVNMTRARDVSGQSVGVASASAPSGSFSGKGHKLGR
ncbi:unnamed protein product [Anisakis simplex]|uniref:DUF4605 domain-containing protein n=1 Tax=Anisakis simplex TaxID=6269 RepID=A0A0M3K9G2_ANISI|nr:unnamed protein product [Anisakis simplex]